MSRPVLAPRPRGRSLSRINNGATMTIDEKASGNASILARHPEVEARLNEIKAEAEAALVPFGKCNRLESQDRAESPMDQGILVEAMNGHQYGAAVSALKEKGILSATGSSDHPTSAHPANLITSGRGVMRFRSAPSAEACHAEWSGAGIAER